jgi:hypothetical protein
MARPDDPPAAPAPPVAAPASRRRTGLVAGIAITLVAIALAVAFGLADDADPGRLVTAVALAQGEGAEAPPPADPPQAAEGEGFGDFAAAAGWSPVGSRSDGVDGLGVTTVFWGAGARRVAHSVLAGAPADPPGDARRTGRRGVLLHSFEAGPRTVVTWTEDGRTSVISAVGVGRGELYDLAEGPPRP